MQQQSITQNVTVDSTDRPLSEVEKRAQRAISDLLLNGYVQGNGHILSADLDGAEIWVHELEGEQLAAGKLVGYSSMRSDWDQSLMEFALDYIVK